MSNWALPLWVYQAVNEHYLAQMQCCYDADLDYYVSEAEKLVIGKD